MKGIFTRWMRFLILTSVLTFTLSIVSYAISDRIPFFSYLISMRGYPWIPSLCVSICILLLAEIPASSDWIIRSVNNQALPGWLRLILGLISGVEFKFKWFEKILLAAGSLGGLVYLWLYPICVQSDDILVSFKIMKGGDLITVVSSGETAEIEGGVIFRLETYVDSVSSGEELPFLECIWANTVVGDTKLFQTRGCRIDFRSGQDKIPDTVSTQLKQWHCPLSKPYPFFIDGSK